MTAPRFALVTGASSGIGEAIGEALADRGYHLLLVSENEPELHRVRQRLAGTYPVEVRALVQDLSLPDAADAVLRQCRTLEGDIEVLVNSAGDYLVAARELEEPAAVASTVTLHVLTPTRLCLLLGRDMVARRRGYILNISSISALFPDPASMTYGPAKAYLRHFSTVLHCDWKAYGVRVTCVLPGGVRTRLFEESGVFIPGFVRRHLLSPRECAERSLRALFRGRRELIPAVSGKLQALLFRLIVRPGTYAYVKRLYAVLSQRGGDPPKV
jgi:short-subunit dehydrogenase